MKKLLCLLLCTLFFISNLSYAQDTKQAINDFLQTFVPDYNQQIFIIKEKTNANHVTILPIPMDLKTIKTKN